MFSLTQQRNYIKVGDEVWIVSPFKEEVCACEIQEIDGDFIIVNSHHLGRQYINSFNVFQDRLDALKKLVFVLQDKVDFIKEQIKELEKEETQLWIY